MLRVIMDIDTALEETMRKMELARTPAPAAIERNVFEADGSMDKMLIQFDRDIEASEIDLKDFEKSAQEDFKRIKLATEFSAIQAHHLEYLDNLIQIIELRAKEISEDIKFHKPQLARQVKQLSHYSKKGASRHNKQIKRMLQEMAKEVAVNLNYALLYRALRADNSNKTGSITIRSADDLDNFFNDLG